MKLKLSKQSKILICTILFTNMAFFTDIRALATENTELNNSSDELIISTYDTDGKSSITKVNPITKENDVLISNQEVSLSGNLSQDKTTLVYMNALGEEPWQVFSLDLKSKKTNKLTTNNVGKFGGKAGQEKDNIIYFGIIDRSTALAKIVKYNTKDKSSIILDSSDRDRNANIYDVRNNKIMAVMVSNSEDNKRQHEANVTHTEIKPIEHSIYEIDSNNLNMKKIASINAESIDTISYNYDCKKAIISGRNINNEKGYGIFEISTESGQIAKLLTDDMLSEDKHCILAEIKDSSPVISKDGNTLYFAAVSKSVGKTLFIDLTEMPQDVYSYNLKTHKIEEVYENRKDTVITDLTISY